MDYQGQAREQEQLSIHLSQFALITFSMRSCCCFCLQIHSPAAAVGKDPTLGYTNSNNEQFRLNVYIFTLSLICRPTKKSRFCYQNIKSSKSVVQTKESIIFSHDFISILLIFCDCSLHFSLVIYPLWSNSQLEIKGICILIYRAKLFLNSEIFHIHILNVESIIKNHTIKS